MRHDHWVQTEGKVKRKQEKIIENSWQHWNTISLKLAALYYAPLFFKHLSQKSNKFKRILRVYDKFKK